MASNDPRPSDAAPADRQLLRVLGPWGATAVVVGSIIGSGIFFKANIVATSVGRFDLVMAVWIVCGLLSLLGALATAELGAMMPHAGGQYVYLREAFGPLSGFLWGWAEFWVMRAGSVAVLAVAFSERFAKLFGVELVAGQTQFVTLPIIGSLSAVWLLRWIAIAAIGLLTAVNYVGARWGGLMQDVTTAFKAATLLGLMVLPFLTMTEDVSMLATTRERSADLGLIAGFAAAMTAVFWAYDGWGNIGPVAEEIRDPQRNVPLSLTVGMLIVIGLYVGATISYHLVLPMETIAGSKFTAGAACDVTLGQRYGAAIASAAVMVSAFGALNANLLTGPRVMFAMARDKLFLAPLSRVHARFRTPHVAILALAVWSVVLILGSDLLKSVTVPAWIDGFPTWLAKPLRESLSKMTTKAIYDVLTDYVVFGAFVFYLLAVVAVFVLRIRRPDLPRPYKTLGYPVLPAIFVLGSAGFLCGMLVTSPVESVLGLVFVSLGAIAYAFRPRDVSRTR